MKEQSSNIAAGDKEKNQLQMCELARELKDELQQNNIDVMGEILDAGWQLKRTLANGISNPIIDEYYDIAMKHGAIGGQLLGAGGGGFLLFYVPEKRQPEVRTAIKLPQMSMSFDRQGSSVIYVGLKPDIY